MALAFKTEQLAAEILLEETPGLDEFQDNPDGMQAAYAELLEKAKKLATSMRGKHGN